MNTELIFQFLRDIACNNTREWFTEHKDEYVQAKAEFESGVTQLIQTISTFDSSVAHVQAKDCMYRFYRDVRFSPDKSPYKKHFGAYISSRGRKSNHAGYYLHVQPGECMIGAGAYCLPTQILTAMRNEIMANIDEWKSCVCNPEFLHLFGAPQELRDKSQGFGLTSLKTIPRGFPKDYEYAAYLKMKDYCVWRNVGDDFFVQKDWLEQMAHMYETAKPMMDFTNSVIDDYE